MLRRLFLEDTPLLDVRAPVEFAHGSFPCAVNLPILDDEERHQIGICYKQAGQQAAVELGHRLVSGEIREQRIKAWADFIASHENTHLYCFRGGQRSAIAEQWLKQAGIVIPRIEGGYKRMRGFLLAQFDDLPKLVLLSGKTGVGKTRVLSRVQDVRPRNVIDLEGRANHRGSAFGKRLSDQPAQIDFENAVAVDLLKSSGTVVLEDESRMIGRINLPPQMQAAMKEAPLVELTASLEDRVNLIREEYIEDRWRALRERVDPETAMHELQTFFMTSLDAIQRRLGGANHQHLKAIMASAFERQRAGDLAGHNAWISALLTDYYDPMYEYQLGRRQGQILFRGDRDAVTDYFTSEL